MRVSASPEPRIERSTRVATAKASTRMKKPAAEAAGYGAPEGALTAPQSGTWRDQPRRRRTSSTCPVRALTATTTSRPRRFSARAR